MVQLSNNCKGSKVNQGRWQIRPTNQRSDEHEKLSRALHGNNKGML